MSLPVLKYVIHSTQNTVYKFAFLKLAISILVFDFLLMRSRFSSGERSQF
ncbi:MAG: hypothetical protein ACK5RE_01380 [Pseudanabaena sp.]